MVKRILSITVLGLGLLLSSNKVEAQTFTTEADTVWYTVNGASADVHNNITNVSSANIQIEWKAVATDFPADWRDEGVLGVCDNNLCRINAGGTGITDGTQTFTSIDYIPNQAGDFHLQLTGMDGVSAGTHYLTMNLKVKGGVDSKDITFVIAKWATNVKGVSTSSDDVVLYPNPARGELNVTYNAKAGIKTAAVYNLIGKQLVAYKVGSTSAKLNIDNIPSGIYFLRLMDANGKVVATRKFTHQ